MPNVVVFALDAAALIAHVGVATRTQSPGAHGRCRTLQSLKLNIGVRKISVIISPGRPHMVITITYT